ncbi:MAG: hypothetical protein HC794_02945 [Nitrospiraceae bacterium]|nr:hypothetical protein [Nitrospiraceae bacterium]
MPWMIPFLTIGIFVIDLLAPVGIAVSILYALPILLTFFSTPRARPALFFGGSHCADLDRASSQTGRCPDSLRGIQPRIGYDAHLGHCYRIDPV